MKAFCFGLAGAVALMSASVAHAAPNLVLNGDFNVTTLTNPMQIGSDSYKGTSYNNANRVAGWTSAVSRNGAYIGYNFIFSTDYSGNGKTSYKSTGSAGSVYLYGLGASADGKASGNFLASDPVFHGTQTSTGDYQGAAISQNIGGLKIGQNYQLSFYWATDQQSSGTTAKVPSYAGWQVSFDGETFSPGIQQNVSPAFSTGWQKVTKDFTYKGASQTLSFLAVGGPAGAPPFVLLDHVSLSAVPEPATWAMMILGFGLVGAGMRRRARVPHATDADGIKSLVPGVGQG